MSVVLYSCGLLTDMTQHLFLTECQVGCDQMGYDMIG